MADRNDKKNTGKTIAIVGGGALLLLLLFRGRGFGLGGSSGDGRAGATPGGATRAAPCKVRIDASGIEVDGIPTDVATTTEVCRAAGSAEVRATGAAITGVIAEVVHALKEAGVDVWAAPEVWDASIYVPARRPT